MEEEKTILDSVYKICACCGQKRTLRNYRLLHRSEFADGITLIADKFSKVCKCCEKHPAMQLKENRLKVLREKLAKYKAIKAKRERKKYIKGLDEDIPIPSSQ